MDDEEVEDKSECRGTETQQLQGGVEAKWVLTKIRKNLILFASSSHWM